MAKAKKKASKAKEPLVVTSKVKAYIKGKGMMTATDAVTAINELLYSILDRAVERAKANRRTTVRPQDL